MSDKLIQFPDGSTSSPIEEETLENMSIEQARDRLKKVEAARRDEVPLLYTDNNIKESISRIARTLEAINTYLDMLKQDLISTVQGLESHAIGAYSAQLHLETLMQVLREKDVITHEEMEKTFAEVHEKAKKTLEEAEKKGF